MLIFTIGCFFHRPPAPRSDRTTDREGFFSKRTLNPKITDPGGYGVGHSSFEVRAPGGEERLNHFMGGAPHPSPDGSVDTLDPKPYTLNSLNSHPACLGRTHPQ